MKSIIISNIFEARALLGFIEKSTIRVHTTSLNAALFLSARLENKEVILHEFKDMEVARKKLSLQALSQAKALDRSTAKILAKCYGRNDYGGWEFWDKFCFFSSILPWQFLQENHKLKIDEPTWLPTYTQPQDYYFSSPVTSKLLAEIFLRAGNEFAPLEISHLPPTRPDIWSSFYNFDEKIIENRNPISLISLATCFYNQGPLRERFDNTEEFVDIESPYHDAPIAKNRIFLNTAGKERELASQPAKYSQFEQIYTDSILALGIALSAPVKAQIAHWIRRLDFQTRLYESLTLWRSLRPIKLAAIGDCDGGIMGPISSAFQEDSDPVAVYPHSYVSAHEVPNIRTPNYFGASSAQDRLRFTGTDSAKSIQPAIKSPRKCYTIKSILLVLNEFDDYSGMPVDRLDFLLDTVQNAFSQLSAIGYAIKVRFKPGFEIPGIGIPREAIVSGAVAHQVTDFDCCITIGQPTTVGMQFHDAGKPLIHVQSTDLGQWDRFTLPAEHLCPIVVASSASDAVTQLLYHLQRLMISPQLSGHI